MIIRHLVLPDNLSQSVEVLRWIAGEIGTDVHISLMSQYFAAYKAVEHPQLKRRIYHREYREVLAAVEALGLENGWQQELDRVY